MKTGDTGKCECGQVDLHGDTMRCRNQLKVRGKNILLLAIFMVIN